MNWWFCCVMWSNLCGGVMQSCQHQLSQWGWAVIGRGPIRGEEEACSSTAQDRNRNQGLCFGGMMVSTRHCQGGCGPIRGQGWWPAGQSEATMMRHRAQVLQVPSTTSSLNQFIITQIRCLPVGRNWHDKTMTHQEPHLVVLHHFRHTSSDSNKSSFFTRLLRHFIRLKWEL